MTQERSFLYLDENKIGQELSISVDDVDSIDTVKQKLKTQLLSKHLRLKHDLIIEFPDISTGENRAFNIASTNVTRLVINPAKPAEKLQPVQAPHVRVDATAPIISAKEINSAAKADTAIKIKPNFEIKAGAAPAAVVTAKLDDSAAHSTPRHYPAVFLSAHRTNKLAPLMDAITNSQQSQGESTLAKKPIDIFIEQLENTLKECDKRLGHGHKHKGVQAIRNSLTKIKANQNNPWALLETLGKEIYQRHYGFLGSIKKYTWRDPLVHAIYSILKQLGKQHCNDPDKPMVVRLKLLTELTVRMKNAPSGIKTLDDTGVPSMLFRK